MTEHCRCVIPWMDPDDNDDPDDGEIGFCWRCRRPIKDEGDE